MLEHPDLPGGDGEVTADDAANGVLAGGLLDGDRGVVDLVLHAPALVGGGGAQVGPGAIRRALLDEQIDGLVRSNALMLP